MTSLKFIREAVLTYFQGGTGETVECFWQQMAKQLPGVLRENRLAKMLGRGKIRNDVEWELIQDLYGPYLEQKLLTTEEVDKINVMISAYESRPIRRKKN